MPSKLINQMFIKNMIASIGYKLNSVIVVMVALCNRADHYIFMLWFVTGSIARSANLPVFSLLRGQF